MCTFDQSIETPGLNGGLRVVQYTRTVTVCDFRLQSVMKSLRSVNYMSLCTLRIFPCFARKVLKGCNVFTVRTGRTVCILTARRPPRCGGFNKMFVNWGRGAAL